MKEFLAILDSFVPRAGQQNSSFKSKVQKIIKYIWYLKNNFFGYRARFPSHRFHINKIVEETDGLEKGRLNLKRRRTILREKYFASSDSV